MAQHCALLKNAADMLETFESVVKLLTYKHYFLLIFIIKFLDSLKKTNRIVFIDEDVPGGAAAFMFNKVMEEQGGYR